MPIRILRLFVPAVCFLVAASCVDPPGVGLPDSSPPLFGYHSDCPNCDERSPTPDELWDMELAILSTSSCPGLQDILLDKLMGFKVYDDDDGNWGSWIWDEGESTIYIWAGHWELSGQEFWDELSETLYHEGAHEDIESGYHDSIWQNTFACYAS